MRPFISLPKRSFTRPISKEQFSPTHAPRYGRTQVIVVRPALAGHPEGRSESWSVISCGLHLLVDQTKSASPIHSQIAVFFRLKSVPQLIAVQSRWSHGGRGFSKQKSGFRSRWNMNFDHGKLVGVLSPGRGRAGNHSAWENDAHARATTIDVGNRFRHDRVFDGHCRVSYSLRCDRWQ